MEDGTSTIAVIRKSALRHLQSLLVQTSIPEHQNVLKSAILKLAACPIRTHPNCSFTLNKKTIYLKIRNLLDEPYEECVLVKVLIHELVHVMQKEYGHTDAFWRINRILYPSHLGCVVPGDYSCVTKDMYSVDTGV